MNTPVTREILHNYLRCKYKGYLKLRGESGTKTDYEILIRELSEKFKLKAVNKIRNNYNDDHITTLFKKRHIGIEKGGTGPPLRHPSSTMLDVLW